MAQDGKHIPSMKFKENFDGIFRKNGKTVPVPICRECQVQAPCSSWDGKYPYGKEEEIIERNILENLEKD